MINDAHVQPETVEDSVKEYFSSIGCDLNDLRGFLLGFAPLLLASPSVETFSAAMLQERRSFCGSRKSASLTCDCPSSRLRFCLHWTPFCCSAGSSGDVRCGLLDRPGRWRSPTVAVGRHRHATAAKSDSSASGGTAGFNHGCFATNPRR